MDYILVLLLRTQLKPVVELVRLTYLQQRVEHTDFMNESVVSTHYFRTILDNLVCEFWHSRARDPP
jgi:hypothetical protein